MGLVIMSETVSKQVLNKLDDIQKDMTDIKVKVVEIETKLNGLPDLDNAKHSVLEQEIEHHDKRITDIEYWGKWIVGCVFLAIITSLLQLVLH